ncbi:MAG TPA: response regulator, partial [Albitalea sp.]
QARPALVVLQESAAAAPEDAEALAALLPPAARCVLSVNAGSPTLRHDAALSRAELRVGPLSPAELQQLTAALAPGADEASGLTRPAPLLLPQRPTLLVVDDNELNRIVAAGLAESLGYNVALACDGVEALDVCFSAPPDVVLMDLAMPRMDGIEATMHLRQLQRSGAMPPFPVIAATADTTEQSRQRCFDAGMDAVLHKPLLRPSLRAELQRLRPADR